jgi:hypothetical protein
MSQLQNKTKYNKKFNSIQALMISQKSHKCKVSTMKKVYESFDTIG